MTASVVYLKNALCPQHKIVEYIHGGTLMDYDPEWDLPYIALVNGNAVLRKDWGNEIAEGDILAFVDVNAIPQDGGGGGSNPLKMILMIAILVFAAPLAGAYLGVMTGVGTVAGWTAVAGMGMMMLVNALIPPPKLPSPQQAAALAAPSPTYNLQAQGNSARLEAAIPEHFGRHIAYPDYAAQPYLEYAGNEQYMYALLCIGRGYYDIEAIRIEDTPIANFDEITYEVVNPHATLSLFPSNVISSVEVSGQDLPTGTYIGPFVASAAGDSANFLGVDFVAPRGLYHANDDGSLSSVSITVAVEARPIDAYGAPTGGWTVLSASTYYSPWSDWAQYEGVIEASVLIEYQSRMQGQVEGYEPWYVTYRRTRTVSAGIETFTGATTTPQRYSVKYPVTAGRYEVRVKRTDTEQTDTRYGHDLVWGGLRAYLPETRDFGDVTLLAMRMRASNNLSMQASRKVNVIATRKIPIWNGSTWSANTATRSIAWPIAYACKQVGLTDAQIDLATLLALDATWTARGDHFDARFDNFISFWEAASKIAGAGRAKIYMQSGVVRVMRDQAATVPVALFSMRNIVKGSFSVNYLMPTADTADAIDVGYFDSVDWAQRRVRAKLPASTAARPAKVELFGVTGRDHAFREGMYQAGANRYRRKIIKFSTEMEGFIPGFGDLIAVQHDMPAWGQGGEITAWNAGSKTATLSEPPTWGSGTHYIALRKRDGSVDGPYAVTAGATPNEVVLASSPAITPYTGGAEERTHYTFGWADAWRQPARLLTAKPSGLYRIEIEAVVEDDNVHTAETGQIAPAKITSQLASYTNAPALSGLTSVPALDVPNKTLLTWLPSPWAEHYLIEQSSDGTTWTRSGDTVTSNFTAIALYGGATIFRVAAVGGLARGPWSQINFVQQFPPDVATITIDGTRLSWPEVMDANVAGYHIKFHYGINTEWATASAMHTGLVTQSPFAMTVVPPGQITVMIRAVYIVDSGIESLHSAYLITNFGDSPVANVVENHDFKAAGWPGTLTNAAIVSGNLQATQSDPFYRLDAVPFFGLDGAPFFTANYDALEWISTGWTPSLAEVGSNMTLLATVGGDAVSIQYRPTGPNAFYHDDLSAFFGNDEDPFFDHAPDWQTWPGAVVVKNQEYQWRVATIVGTTSGLLSAFALSIDVPDKTLQLNGISITSGGTRLTSAIGEFNSIQNIQLTLQGGSTAMKLEIADKSVTLGPLIYAKDASGSGVSANIDALLQGY